jgi:hypothetical protein
MRAARLQDPLERLTAAIREVESELAAAGFAIGDFRSVCRRSLQ